MSLLVTFAGFSELDLLFEPQQPDAGCSTPVHCGGPMALQTQGLGPTTVGYTFEPVEGPVQLPPVWRCGCGFQLDAWVPPATSADTAAGVNPSAAPLNH